MLNAIAVYWRDFPQALVEAHGLQDRKIVRHEGAEPEIRFPLKAVPRVLPALDSGKLRVCCWGACARTCPLPAGG
jgi:hypothetical protein